MIRLLLISALLGLTGCMQHASTEAVQTQHDRQCAGMGAPRGSVAYTQCRLILYRQHENDRRYERARTGAMIQAVTQNMARQRQERLRRVYLPPSRSCTHQVLAKDMVSTTCH